MIRPDTPHSTTGSHELHDQMPRCLRSGWRNFGGALFGYMSCIPPRKLGCRNRPGSICGRIVQERRATCSREWHIAWRCTSGRSSSGSSDISRCRVLATASSCTPCNLLPASPRALVLLKHRTVCSLWDYLGHRAGVTIITTASGHSQHYNLILGRAPAWQPSYLEVNGNQCAIATYETGQLQGVMTPTCRIRGRA